MSTEIKQKKRIAIIGAGASGIFCAANLMESAVAANLTIDIFEALARPLKKVLISGGGRCNLTHMTADVQELISYYPRGNKFLRSILHSFHVSDTLQWFARHGVKTYVDASGCVFPLSDRSESVIDALLDPIQSLSVAVKCHRRINDIRYEYDRFSLRSDDFTADYDIVLIATGGAKCVTAISPNPDAYRLPQNLGHRIVPPRAGLCGMLSGDRMVTDLAGIVIATAKTTAVWQGKKVAQTSGEVLFTHRGISGPAILDLSSLVSHLPFHSQDPLVVSLHLTSQSDISGVDRAMIQAISANPNKSIVSVLCAMPLPRNLAKCILDRCGIEPSGRSGNVTRNERRNICQQLFAFTVAVCGVDNQQAMVTCGGIDLREVYSRSLQSKLVPGLYFSGEVLDVDGFCGGFNLQFAWSSGYLVSQAILKSLDSC